MADLATLKIAVDTSQLADATKLLNAFTEKAKSVEGEVSKLAKSQQKQTQTATEAKDATAKLVLTFESQINALKAVQNVMTLDAEVARSSAVQRRLYNSALASSTAEIDVNKIALAKQVEGLKQSNAAYTAQKIALSGLTDLERESIKSKAQHSIEVKKVTDAVKAEYVASQQATAAADAHIVAYNREIAASRTYQEQLGKEIIQLQKRELSGTGLSAGNKTLFSPIGQDPNVIRAHNAALSTMNGTVTAVAQSTSIMDKYSHQFMRTLVDLTPIISGLGLLTLAHGAIQATDQYTKLTSQLKTATNSTSEYAQAMSEVKRISSAAQVDIGAIGSLYQRLSLATQASGTSQKEVALITETVSLGLKANGASARESASAMLQLSQSFGSGRMAGEEFNSMAEAAPNVLRALATSMGVPYGALKQLASEGKITTEVMVKAFTDPALLASFQAQAASMRTITGSWVELTNALVLYVGEGSKSSGVTKVLSGSLSLIADNIKFIGDAVIFVASAMALQLSGSILKAAADLVLLEGAATKAMARLTALSITTKGGLIGLALFAAYEVADYMGLIDMIFSGAEERIKKLRADIVSTREIAFQTKTGKQDGFNVVPGLAGDAVAAYAKSTGPVSGDMSNFIKDSSFIFGKDFLSKEQEKAAKVLEIKSTFDKELDRLYKNKTISDENRHKAEAQLYKTKWEKLAEIDKNFATKEPKLSDSQSAMNAEYSRLMDVKQKYEAIASNEKISETAISKTNLLQKAIANVTPAMVEQAAAEADAARVAAGHTVENNKLIESFKSSAEKLNAESVAIERKTATMGMSASQIADYDARQIDSKLHTYESIQALMENSSEMEKMTYASYNTAIATLEVTSAEGELKTSIDKTIAALKRKRDAQTNFSSSSAAQAAIDAQRKEWEKVANGMEGIFKRSFVSILDGSKNIWIGMRDGFKSIFIDAIYEMLVKKYVMTVIIGTVGTGVAQGAVAGGVGQSIGTAAVGAGAGTGIMGAIGTAGIGASGATGMIGGWTAAGGFGASSAAAAHGAAVAGGTTSATIGAYAAAAAPFVVGAVAAYMIAKYGFGMGNSRENVGGNRLVGQFTREGFTGNRQQSWSQSGGWFGSDSSGVDTSAISTQESRNLGRTVGALQRSFNNLGDAIGSTSVRTQNWTMDINLAGDITGALADSIGTQLVPSLEKFREAGENLAQTASRVTDAFLATSQFISGLGTSEMEAFGAIGIASGDARLALIEAAGGLQNFSALAGQFSSSILTPAEQLNVSLDAVGRTFASLGITGVYTKEAFRQLIQDNIGNPDTVVRLLAVSGAFGNVVDSAEKAAKATQDLADANKKLAQDQYKTAIDAVNALRDASLKVRELMLSLRTGSLAPGGANFDLLRKQFIATNALAASGDIGAQGKLASNANAFLEASKAQARSAIDYAKDFSFVNSSLETTATSMEGVVTAADQALQAAVDANVFLQAIQDNTSGTKNNITALALALDGLPPAIVTANGTISDGMVAAFGNFNTAVTSSYTQLVSAMAAGYGNIVSAISSMTSAASVSGVTNMPKPIDIPTQVTIPEPTPTSATGTVASAADLISGAYNNAVTTIADQTAANASEARKERKAAALVDLMAKKNEVDTWTYEGDARGSLRNIIIGRHAISWNAQHNREVDNLYKIYDDLPAFATGTNVVPFDMNARIHAGEEIKPRAYVDKDKSSREETNKILSELKAEVIELKAAQIATTFNTHKTAKILDRFDGQGMPEVREAA